MPDQTRGQLVLGDQVAGALDQGGQDLERAAARPDGSVPSSSSSRAGSSRKGPNANVRPAEAAALFRRSNLA